MTTQALYHSLSTTQEETIVEFHSTENDKKLTVEEIENLAEETTEIEFFLGCLAY